MKLITIYSLVACLTGGSVYAQTQTDSVRTEYQTEDEAISRSEIQRVIRYITRANVEEKTLIKIGGLPNSNPFTQTGGLFTGGLNTDISIERKINPSFSVLFGFDNQVFANYYRREAFSRISPGPGPLWLTDHTLSLSSSAKVAVRYYYSMARRIKEGKSANNFSGTYVAFQVRRPVLSYLKRRQYELVSGDTRTEAEASPLGTLNTPSLSIQWGIQQRLGRRGYIDLNVGPELTLFDSNRAYNSNNSSRTQLTLRVSAIIGLGW
ncbi:hypothetical protein [Spirosoma validum]|uniref:PorT family protein n=1 Tax=Spirosoma validum TaxID=2771355 RepID=A0A927B3N8_9BACT|nr:hypothetical protein [Spirosoma validum]MBD2754798.1 hypothetical protein [Spirosoma validum]